MLVIELKLLGDPERAKSAGARNAVNTQHRRYSAWMLAALTNSPRTARPSLTTAASSAGVLGATARPSAASFSFTAPVVSTFTIASLRRAISGEGVPAGAK